MVDLMRQFFSPNLFLDDGKVCDYMQKKTKIVKNLAGNKDIDIIQK